MFKFVDGDVWKNIPTEISQCLKSEGMLVQLLGGIEQDVVNHLIGQFTQLTKEHGLLLVIDSHGGDTCNMERLRTAINLLNVPKAIWVVSRAHGAALELMVTAFPRERRFAQPEATFTVASSFADLRYAGQVNTARQLIDGLPKEVWRAKIEAWFDDAITVSIKRNELWSPVFASEADRLGITISEYLAMNLEISSHKALELGIIGKIISRSAA